MIYIKCNLSSQCMDLISSVCVLFCKHNSSSLSHFPRWCNDKVKAEKENKSWWKETKVSIKLDQFARTSFAGRKKRKLFLISAFRPADDEAKLCLKLHCRYCKASQLPGIFQVNSNNIVIWSEAYQGVTDNPRKGQLTQKGTLKMAKQTFVIERK